MRIVLEIVWEMAVIIVIVGMLSAILAVPVWGLITTFLWANVAYRGALFVSMTLLLGVCMVLWVVELAKGVRL